MFDTRKGVELGGGRDRKAGTSENGKGLKLRRKLRRAATLTSVLGLSKGGQYFHINFFPKRDDAFCSLLSPPPKNFVERPL